MKILSDKCLAIRYSLASIGLNKANIYSFFVMNLEPFNNVCQNTFFSAPKKWILRSHKMPHNIA